MSRMPQPEPVRRVRAWVAAVIALLATAVGADAQDIALRGGEHAAFTRLVAELPHGTRWSMVEVSGGVELRFADPAPRFDLSQTFARIPRTRVSAVDAISDGLRIALACPCPVRVVEEFPGLLVIDVRDPVGVASPQVAGPTTEPGGLPDAAGRALASRWRTDARSGSADALGIHAPAPLPKASAEFRTALRRAIHDAAEQGILDRDPEAVTPRASADPVFPLQQGPLLIPQVRIAAPPPERSESPARLCLPDASFALADWGVDGPVHGRIADLRGRLTGEFDRANRDAVLELVRYYIHLGFGAEARALMRAFPVAIENRDILRALAHVVDHALPPVELRLTDQAGCPSAAAFWALMSTPDGVAIDALDTAAVQRAFLDLPAHLRRALGPGTVERLLALGHSDAARAIRDATDRAHRGTGMRSDTPLALAGARIDLAADDPASRARGQAALETLDSAEALTLRLDRMAARADPSDHALLSLAQSVAAERRGTPQGHALLAAVALAAASAGDFDAAFDALRRLARDAPASADDLRDSVYEALAQTEDDARFVSTIFATRPWDDPQLAPPARVALGERLALLGFPAHARAILAVPELSGSARAALARARSYQSEGETEAALAALNRHTGPEIEAMREELGRAPLLPVAGQLQSPAATNAPIDDRAAAGSVQPTELDSSARNGGGLLGQGVAALESGQVLRSRIEDLLAVPIDLDQSAP